MTPSNKPPRIHRLGVLGLGEGRSILSAATSSESWELARICDLDENLCRSRSAEFGDVPWTLSYAEMLADPSVEAVGIYTPDQFHAEHLRLALQAGKHVICTKPVVTDLGVARDLLELARGSGQLVLAGHSCRFFETFLRQRADLEAGRHGQLLSVEAHYHGDKRRGTSGRWGRGGAADWLYTGLSHAADLVYWHLGPIDEVMGYALTSPAGAALGQPKPDTFHFAVRAVSGAVASMSGCFGSPEAPFHAQGAIACALRGATGTSIANYPALSYHTHFDGEQDASYDFVRTRAHHYFRFPSTWGHAGEFQNYLEHFGECIETQRRPQPDLADGFEVIATLVAAERALAAGQPMKVAAVLDENGLGGLRG